FNFFSSPGAGPAPGGNRKDPEAANAAATRKAQKIFVAVETLAHLRMGFFRREIIVQPSGNRRGRV
ncbi:hypothetical protein, partial [Pantoea piersonii]|uniref:hypothetical protein n=1 Tax=Pantoea piersonii TaxID=2364647 RepID=UPI001D3EC081